MFNGEVCHFRNYWRDRKSDLPLDEGPHVILEEKEKVESMKRTVKQLSRLLLPEELACSSKTYLISDMFSLHYFTSIILCTLVNVFPDEPVATRRQINRPELT